MESSEVEIVEVEEQQRCPHCSEIAKVRRHTITYRLSRLHVLPCASCGEMGIVFEELGAKGKGSGFPAYQLYEHYEPDRFRNVAVRGRLLWPQKER